MKETVKTWVSFFGRVALSAGLLWWLFSSSEINWADICRAVRTADVVLLWWAFGVFVLINFILLVRWQLFMRAMGLKAPLGWVARYFFIGLFCNLFLPTAIGGDLVKAIGLSRRVGQKAKVFASIVLDRLSGFAGLVIVALMAYSIATRVVDAPSVFVPVLILTVGSLAIGGMLFHRPTYAFFCAVFKGVPRMHKALMDMHADVMLMQGKKRTGLGCILISCAVQVIGAYMYYLIALALHMKIRFLYFVIFAPIIGAWTMMPSLGGLGFREGGWVYFLGKVGVDKGLSASISLLSFFFIIVVGLIGGIVYVATFSSRRVQSASKDAAAG